MAGRQSYEEILELAEALPPGVHSLSSGLVGTTTNTIVTEIVGRGAKAAVASLAAFVSSEGSEWRPRVAAGMRPLLSVKPSVVANRE